MTRFANTHRSFKADPARLLTTGDEPIGTWRVRVAGTMERTLVFTLLLGCHTIAVAQPGTVPGTHEAVPAPTQALQGNWNAATNQQNMAIYEGLLHERPDDGMLRYQRFQNERQTSLATNNGRLPAAEAERLERLAGEVALHDATGMGGALATYYLRFPAPEAFEALRRAEAIAPGHVELIAPRLARAMLEGNNAGLRQASDDLRSKGGVAPGLWAYAEDLFRSLDADAVLVFGGDLDGYPAVALQQAARQRPDVLLVDARLLTEAGYRTRQWKAAGASGAAPAAGAWVTALAGATKRPVHVSMALDRSLLDALRGRLRPAGLTFRIGPPAPGDLRLLGERWEAMHRTPDAGPLSWNYLLAGSVLLRHHRNTGDEAALARTEHALRRLADRIGATPRLYELGVLIH